MITMSAPKVGLELVPVVKSVVYAGLAGELVRNMGMKDMDQVGAVQQCISDGLITRVIVRGRHPDGREETVTLAVKPFDPTEKVMLQKLPGASFCEMLDVTLAAGVQHAATTFKRMGLVPRFEVEWSDKAKASPQLVANAARTLNIAGPKPPPPPPPLPAPPAPYQTWAEFGASLPPSPPPRRYPQTVHTFTVPPPVPAGYQRVTLLEVTPARDPGVTLTIESTRKV